MLDANVQDLRDLLRQSSSTPWAVGTPQWVGSRLLIPIYAGSGVRDVAFVNPRLPGGTKEADAQLIVAMRDLLPDLLDEVARLTARVKELESATCTTK